MNAVPGIVLTEVQVLSSVKCPACGQGPGLACRSRGQRVVPCHRARYLAAKDYAYEHARLERWQQSVRGSGK